MAGAGGKTAALRGGENATRHRSFGQIIPTAGEPNPTAAATLRERLGECVETGEDGRPRLTVTLPNTEALTALADALARLMGK